MTRPRSIPTEAGDRRTAPAGRLGRWAPISWLAAVVITAVAAEHSSATETPTRPATIGGDTIPVTARRLFERRVLFRPEFLSRLFDAASRPARSDPIDTAAPDERGRAAEYARRFGISDALSRLIVETALLEGIDPALAFRVVQVESRFRPTARGPRGALGLMQLMPRTARSIDGSLRTEADVLDPARNLRAGLRYLRSLLERYDGDLRLGLLAYNRGTGTVDRAIRQGRDPDNGYPAKVLGTAADRYTGPGLIDPRR